jgi:methylenetetrahydrofolate reductase (NADPH)
MIAGTAEGTAVGAPRGGRPLTTESRLERLFAQGEFVVTSEIGPPKSASSKGIRTNAALLREVTDGQNLTDNQTAIVRLSSLAAAVHVKAEGGEPIMQMVCRDRNRIAMQSDILGAYSLGIRNLVCLSGDHQSFGNHATAKNVFDLDSIQLINMVKRMRDDRIFLSGEEIKVAPPRMYIGAAENPFADPFEFRVVRLEKKVNAGVQFIQTQCVFDLDRFARFMAKVVERGLHERVHIMAGVTPAKSAKALKYMKSVPGMLVPDALVERMERAENPEEEGIAVCVETLRAVRGIPGVRGAHIMAIAWEHAVPVIVERAGLLPRPKVRMIEE